ncbi:MAG: c-type cytochrome [Tepidisphaeraceae bacterium]
MADNANKRSYPLINGRFPAAPFWVKALVLIGACLSIFLVMTLLRARMSHSDEPRVHLIQDMDNQVKVKTQHASEVFADGTEVRPPIPGTVSRENYYPDPHLAHGFTQKWNASKNAWDVTFDAGFPSEIKVDDALLRQGQKKFNTYCMPCHGYDGTGNGPVNYRAQELSANGVPGMSWVPPKNLTEADIIARPDGHIFNTITNGIRNMAGYGSQIPDPHDRWAIVAYVRALEVSHSGYKAPATQPMAMK